MILNMERIFIYLMLKTSMFSKNALHLLWILPKNIGNYHELWGTGLKIVIEVAYPCSPFFFWDSQQSSHNTCSEKSQPQPASTSGLWDCEHSMLTVALWDIYFISWERFSFSLSSSALSFLENKVINAIAIINIYQLPVREYYYDKSITIINNPILCN